LLVETFGQINVCDFISQLSLYIHSVKNLKKYQWVWEIWNHVLLVTNRLRFAISPFWSKSRSLCLNSGFNFLSLISFYIFQFVSCVKCSANCLRSA